MKRNVMIDVYNRDIVEEHKQRIAFHEAGHASAIYLNSKAKNLPPVYFQIKFKDFDHVTEEDVINFQTTHDDCIAHVEGGRLIESLPPSLDGFIKKICTHNEAMLDLLEDYMTAFETDIVNLLIGPLAEAKYVADKDDELINHHLVNMDALKNYGGSSDLAVIHEYLQSYSASQQQHYEKLGELFRVAFNFVTDSANWQAISRLAQYIVASNKNCIRYEEVVAVLER